MDYYGLDSDFGVSAYSGTIVWSIISIIIAIIGGLALYYTVFSKNNEGKFTGFMAWLYDFVTFKKLLLEPILKILYIITAIYITLSSFTLIASNFFGFVLLLTLGNVIARIVYEFSLLIITICKNTIEINQKLSKTKTATKKVEKK